VKSTSLFKQWENTAMRLTIDQVKAIRQTAQRVLGAGARVSVFGSRALDLARKEAAHLQYTHRTLFAQPIDAAWVQRLTTRDDLAEKIDAFVSPRGGGDAFSHGRSHWS
jgi:hypothetical protein